MIGSVYHWERELIERALAALHDWRPLAQKHAVSPDRASAYACCAAITKQHSRTFYLASGLLPVPQRMAVRALYAFCRISDEIVDNRRPDGVADAPAALAEWRRQVLDCSAPDDPVLRAWADTRRRYHIPDLYVEQQLAGVAYDVAPRRYDTFADLTDYCYGVACTVGLMSMHITGFSTLAAVPYSIKLGLAL